MKREFSIKNLAVLVAISAFITCSAFTSVATFGWEKLGMRVVDYGLDRDEIPVTLLKGRFDAVKLMVNRSPIHVHRFVIHFSSGGTQEVIVRKRIPRGGETRIIDLKGGNRSIKKVVFWYDTGKLARGRAVIELWARR